MNEELKNEIIRLINLKRTNNNDVQSMINIIREHIDSKISICNHCAAQIRFAQRRLMNWYNSQIINQEGEPQEPLSLPEPTSKKPGCSSCKKKTINPKQSIVINTPKSK